MDYEQVTTDEMLTSTETAIGQQEREHLRLTLERIANAGNPAAVRNIDDQIAMRERAVAGLRAERDRLKLAQAADRDRAAAAEPPAPPADVDTPAPEPLA